MKTNERLKVTDARVGRASAAPSGSAAKVGTPQELTEGNEGSEGEESEHRQTRTDTDEQGQGGEFISKKELASRLRVTVRTISNWQRRGIVPFVKCRRAIYYDWPAVAAQLRARARPCKAAPEGLLRIPLIGVAGDGRKHQAPRKRGGLTTDEHG